jgi:hypothetical protein
MAVDLATSGSLGYGIGLQAKVPDKTGLVLQLENQRLKRQALANQAQEQEEQKAAKQEAMFQKAINVDTTKWHRTLVGKVNQAANEAVNEYSRLYAENPRVAQNSINQIMRKFNEQVGQLNTDNEQRKQMHTFLNNKVSKNEAFIGDEDEAYNYLNTGDDAALTQPYQTSLGEYTFNPNSTIQINAIGKSTANEDAAKFSGNDKYADIDFVMTGIGKNANKIRNYTPDKVKEYMADRYKDNGIVKRGEDIAYNKPALKAAWIAGGFDKQMTLDQFVRSTDKTVSDVVDNVLINYHQNLLSKNAPKDPAIPFSPFDNVVKAARDLSVQATPDIRGNLIYTTRAVPQTDIDAAWLGFKNDPVGKASIKYLGGEAQAKSLFDAYIKNPQQGISQMGDYYGGGGGFKVGDYNMTENAPVEDKLLYSYANQNVDNLKKNLTKEGLVYNVGDKYYDKNTGAILDDEWFLGKLSEQAEKLGTTKSLFLSTEGTTNLTFGAGLPKRLNKSVRWSTGGKGAFDYVDGMFSHLIKDDATGKIIGVAVRKQVKPGEFGRTEIVPYNSVNKGIFGAGKEVAKVQQKSGSMLRNIKYKVGNTVYSIPLNEEKKFLKDNPKAVKIK